MVSINDIKIDPSIPRVKFACDLARCKGACCTMPGPRGAPLTENEVAEIEKALPVIRKYLGEDHLSAIDERGLVDRSFGEITTTCFEHRACVFVTYEDGIAKCSFEKAFFKGEIGWRKPLSCHLFPIRVDHGFNDYLRYESIPDCAPALERGERENIELVNFLEHSLTRAYGESWYDQFRKLCASEKQTSVTQASK